MEKRTQEEEKLIMDLLPLVKHVAFKIRAHLPVHVEVDDLIANGVLGLMDEIGKFDPSKRVKRRKLRPAPHTRCHSRRPSRRRSGPPGLAAVEEQSAKTVLRTGEQTRSRCQG